MAWLDVLIPEFDHEMGTTRRLLERVPQDGLGWKPHPRSMSLGELAQHVATLPMWGHVTLARAELDLAEGPRPELVHTVEGLLALFDGHVRQARATLAAAAAAEFTAPWTLKQQGKPLFTMPKIVVWRSFVMSHLVHHRGQLALYLRMNDVPVPSIYGPSADEAVF